VNTVRVLLADDHALVRAGIQSLLETIEGMQIVAQAANGREAVAMALAHKPALVVMDISMKELNGIEATRQIKALLPDTRVLMLSMHTSGDFVRDAIMAGASGYLVKDSAPADLQRAIEAIMRDEIYVCPRVSRHLVDGFLRGKGASPASSIDSLTPRQREILQMIAEGKSTKEIAFVLDVSVKTVETHRTTLMERTGIHDVAGLVVYAIQHGVITVDRPDD
jgi:DNA-binding NarL/FixJ family response regulator